MHSWIEKQRNIIDFTLSSLSRRKGKNIALLLVYTLLVFLLASVMFFTHALKREAALTLRDAPEIVVQRTSEGRYEPIPRKYIEVLNKIKGVTSVRGRLWGYYYDSVVGANYTIMVPENFPYKSGDITIGSGVSRVRLAVKDDMVPLRTYDGISIPFHIRECFFIGVGTRLIGPPACFGIRLPKAFRNE